MVQRTRHRIRDTMSATTLVGDTVINPQGEDLGKVEDIMLDIHEGRVAYVVLSFGGFMGMGNKLFAIPWKALSLSEERHAFILDVEKDRLKNAPGFDKDNWPDMTQDTFGTEVYEFYGQEPYWERRNR